MKASKLLRGWNWMLAEDFIYLKVFLRLWDLLAAVFLFR